MQRRRKLFPTKLNSQHTTGVMPIAQLLGYLNQLVQTLKPEERDTVTIELGVEGPTGFAVYYLESIDEAQVQALQFQMQRAALEAAAGNAQGLQPAEITALLQRTSGTALFPADE